MNKHLLRLLLSPDEAAGGAALRGDEELDTDEEFDAITGFTPPDPLPDAPTPDATDPAVGGGGEAPGVPPGPTPVAGAPTPDDEDGEGAGGDDDNDDGDGDGEPTTPAKPAAAAPDVKPANGATPQARDYSKFPAELRDFAAKLPNAFFARAEKELVPLIEKAKQFDAVAKERDELKVQLGTRPSFAHEHPEGYTLDPQYRQIADLAERCEFEEAHWKEQLIRIENGQAYQNLLGYDKKTGQPVFQTVNPPPAGTVDTRAKVEVSTMLNEANRQRANYVGLREQFRGSYAEQVQRAQAELLESERTIFKNLDADKLAPDEQKYMTYVRGAIPRVHQNHPLVKHLGLAFVAYVRLAKQYGALASKQAAAGKTAARVVQRGPRPATASTPAAVKPNEVWDLKQIANDED